MSYRAGCSDPPSRSTVIRIKDEINRFVPCFLRALRLLRGGKIRNANHHAFKRSLVFCAGDAR